MQEETIAFIDGQNLYQGMSRPLDYKKFKIYLRDKYKVTTAYYFLGFRDMNNSLYTKLQKAGFVLIFNAKGEHMVSHKKGNVDTNLAFHMMKTLYEGTLGKAVLISGDGDYKMVVDYLIGLDRFKKILSPNVEFASSLYRHRRNLESHYFDYLDKSSLRKKIGYFPKQS